MVVIDSDIFIIHYRHRRDDRSADNTHFLRAILGASPAITIYTLMEVLGQLSFNLSADVLARWPEWLQDAHGLNVLWPQVGDMSADNFFVQQIYGLPFSRMLTHRIPFADALMLQVAEHVPQVRVIVTWNARHFKGKTSLPILTPAEYLAGATSQPA